MSHSCPYCDLAQKKGELYCSRHSADMHSLNSGVFFIREKIFEECDWHVTRLSLNFNFDGPQTYFAGNREYRISPDKFLLINQGQSFKTFARSLSADRMVTIAFKVGLAEQIYGSLSKTNEQLLDQPDTTASQSLRFFEKTYAIDNFLQQHVLSLLPPENASTDPNELNEKLEAILTHILVLQKGVQREVSSINKVRASTRA